MRKLLIFIAIFTLLVSSGSGGVLNVNKMEEFNEIRTEYKVDEFGMKICTNRNPSYNNDLDYNKINDPEEGLDQSQIYSGDWGALIGSNYVAAQSFRPEYKTLSSIKLLLAKSGYPEGNLYIKIRRFLRGSDIAVASINFSGGVDWRLIEFKNVDLQPEKEYYILLTSPKSRNGFYVWRGGISDEGYKNGRGYKSYTYGLLWKKANVDFCFKTYYYSPVEKVDQQQLVDSGWGVGIGGGHLTAQSFIPSCNILTKIDLHISKGNGEDNLYIKISDSLNGSALTSVTLPSNEIPCSVQYLTINFPDIKVNLGNTYYIIFSSPNSSRGGWYLFGTLEDVYNKGEAYFSGNGGITWGNKTWFGFKEIWFRTYGRDGTPPNIPEIFGPATGKVRKEYTYKASAIDIDGDNLYYLFDWGDGRFSDWLGPYKSGEEIQVENKWGSPGNYEIRVTAKDGNGGISGWSVPFPVGISRYISFPCNLALLFKGKPLHF